MYFCTRFLDVYVILFWPTGGQLLMDNLSLVHGALLNRMCACRCHMNSWFTLFHIAVAAFLATTWDFVNDK